MRMIDTVDRQILKLLQENGRTSNAEIARQVGLAPSAIFERVRKLEERGIIEGYTARLSPRRLGLNLLAFVFVRTEAQVGDTVTSASLSAIPEVQEVHHIAGEDCLLVKIRAADTEDLARLLRERVGTIASVRSTRTTIVLQTTKEATTLPLFENGGTGDGGSDE